MRTIEQLNSDLSLDNLWVWWCGQRVALMLGNPAMTCKTVAMFDATIPDLQGRIIRYLNKASYRCTQVHDGKIWL